MGRFISGTDTHFVVPPNNISDNDIVHAKMILNIFFMADHMNKIQNDPSFPSRDEFPTIIYDTPPSSGILSLIKSFKIWLNQKLTHI